MVTFHCIRLLGQKNLEDLHGQGQNKITEEDEKEDGVAELIIDPPNALCRNKCLYFVTGKASL